MTERPAATASRLEIGFPGGARVEARYHGQTIFTDQPVHKGGDGSAASPFDLFLASIATCAGYYAHEFCRRRGLSTAGLGLTLEPIRDAERRMVERVVLRLELPRGFPDRYRRAIERAVDQCSVKRHLASPPAVELEIG